MGPVVLATNFLPVGFFAVFLVVGLVTTVIWLWALVDALRISDERWAAAGQSKLIWVLVIVLLGVLGALLYALIARPALAARRA
jgi:hypothetical protein